MAVQPRRGMTIHRTQVRRRESPDTSLFDPVVAVTVTQCVLCLVLTAGLFTLQFIDRERYEQLGVYYQAVMSGEPGEAVFVGNFGQPIDFSRIQEYFETASDGAKALTEALIPEEGGMGGETPYIPSNVYYGPVLFTAPARYPAYGTITSAFGPRTHPITGEMDFHTGIDVAAAEGESIYAVYSGTVEETGTSQIYGNYIRVRHSPRLVTVYSHCSQLLAEQGAVVRAGERIAEVGSTGVSTGPHVHLEVMVDGCYADPMELYKV